MKRFFACFAIFAALIFVTSCGSSSKTGDNTDTGDTTTDSDTGDSGSTDNPDSDNPNTTPDTGDSAPDNEDSTPDNDTDSGDTAPDYDNGNSTPDSDPSDPVNENPDNLPECSATSATPCIDSEAVNSDSEKTYLIWSGKSPERLRWVDAVEYCSNLNEGGFNDWLIPSIAALQTLRSTLCDLGGSCSKFGDIAFFWSGTQGAGFDFYTGGSPYKSDSETFDVRCVRKEITTPRNKECPELEFENTVYNSVSSITQTWKWDCVCWGPTNKITYNTTPSITECRFTCKPGCNRYNNQCIDPTVECSPTSSTPCTDPSTGLIWSSKVEESCANLTEGGFNDWREPDLSEIRTLIRNCPSTITGGDCNLTTSCAYRNDACDGCNYDDNGKYNLFGDSGIFVSTTVHDGWAEHYLYVDFDYAALYDYGTYPNKSRLHRCVRSSICDQNYFWNGSECEAAPSQTANCIGLPENAEWNKADKITQTWNGYQWLPTTKGIFDPTESTSDCHFKCASGYSWNGSQCKKIPECEPVNNNSAPCIDTENGIIWSGISPTSMRFDNMYHYCSYNIYGGFTDWRAPNIDELKTLLIWSKANSCKVSAVNNCLTDYSDSSQCWTCSTCTEQGTPESGSWYCNGYGEAYSDGRFSKFGDSTTLGSSSRVSTKYYNSDPANWTVNFIYGRVSKATYQYSNNTSPSINVRCVRNAE